MKNPTRAIPIVHALLFTATKVFVMGYSCVILYCTLIYCTARSGTVTANAKYLLQCGTGRFTAWEPEHDISHGRCLMLRGRRRQQHLILGGAMERTDRSLEHDSPSRLGAIPTAIDKDTICDVFWFLTCDLTLFKFRSTSMEYNNNIFFIYGPFLSTVHHKTNIGIRRNTLADRRCYMNCKSRLFKNSDTMLYKWYICS